MTTSTLPPLTALGHALPPDPAHFGELRSSSDLLGRGEALRARLEEDGYLYIPGFFAREDIFSVRANLTDLLAAQGCLDAARPSFEAVVNPDLRGKRFEAHLPQANPGVDGIVFGGQLVSFYETLFGEPIRHFDFKWFRAVGPGPGTHPHCDLPYMGRGTRNLLTCWIPYGDVPLDLGGLMVLENSHRQSERIRAYLDTDVDSYCENRPKEVAKVKEGGGWSHPGWLSTNPVSLQQKLGGRWLTADWKAGDFLTFRMDLVHGSLDNHTDQVRLSSDTRYQRASEPIDGRWIGANPPGHSRSGKLGRIC